MILPEIDPVALQIGPLAIRWYSLTWMAAFIGIYSIAKYRLKNILNRTTQRPYVLWLVGGYVRWQNRVLFFLRHRSID